MTRDDRSAPRDREQIQPDGLAARARDAAPADTGAVDSSPAPQGSGRKSFNPWRFGFHTVSADHRRELLEMELPETPPERLFDEQSLAGRAETSDPAPTTPLVHPWRLAAVWAGLAAVAVVVLLLLVGGAKSASEAKATTAMPSTSTAATARAAALALTQPPAASPSVTDAAPPDDSPASKAASTASPSKKPEASAHAASAVSRPAQRATTQPNTTSDTKPSAAPKPMSPTSDDDASPFGHWTAPPRDN